MAAYKGDRDNELDKCIDYTRYVKDTRVEIPYGVVCNKSLSHEATCVMKCFIFFSFVNRR